MISPEKLRAAQLKMLEILKEVVTLCDKHHIPYWLDAGTLLGAIRHRGFIPWDDDIDIAMLRSDYTRFLEVCKTELPAHLFLQTEDTDPYEQTMHSCKIRLDNSFVIEESSYRLNTFDLRAHNGLFIDIFPFDFYPAGKCSRWFLSKVVSPLLLLLKYRNKSMTFRRMKVRVVRQIVKFTFTDKMAAAISQFVIKRLNRKQRPIVSYSVDTIFEKTPFKLKDVMPLSTCEFEGATFKAPASAHGYLTEMFGDDYMSLPPEEKRTYHLSELVLDTTKEPLPDYLTSKPKDT